MVTKRLKSQICASDCWYRVVNFYAMLTNFIRVINYTNLALNPSNVSITFWKWLSIALYSTAGIKLWLHSLEMLTSFLSNLWLIWNQNCENQKSLYSSFWYHTGLQQKRPVRMHALAVSTYSFWSNLRYTFLRERMGICITDSPDYYIQGGFWFYVHNAYLFFFNLIHNSFSPHKLQFI